MLALAATLSALWFQHPAPLDMPRAEAFLVSEGETIRLEDRYDVRDLWTSRAVLGRWEDDDGRVFTVSRLDALPPLEGDVATLTRAAYDAGRVLVSKKEADPRDQAVSRLSPLPLPEESASPRQEIRGLDQALYYHGTNQTAVVCAFLPEKSEVWYLATWELIAGDEFAAALEAFEDGFLRKWETVREEVFRSETGRPRHRPGKTDDRGLPERELLRADARHSVTNYSGWHVTDGDEFTVLDDLPAVVKFVPELTNDLKRMRARYSEVMPSPLDGSNVLCVARILRDRDEYLDTVGDDMKWSAAYWSPLRRELVAYLPEGGARELLKTIRHEAFHQYLSYGASMISVSPWLNEGYAQYFEDEESLDWELKDVALGLDELAKLLPTLLTMDYERFYGGTDAERLVKYRLAWSVAVFLERGAPKVRFQPFRHVKRDYLAALLKSRDMVKATGSVFGNPDFLKSFVAEWKRFWLDT